MNEADTAGARIGILWRGDPRAEPPPPEHNRLRAVFATLANRGASAEPVVYADEVVDEVRARLLEMDGVLVWVNPIVSGQDRTVLDAMLREVASRGVWVSAHPDVIRKMGTKDVLYHTRHMPWGTDTRLYRTIEDLRRELPAVVSSGPRVLKQHRGNGGNGVWKVRLVRDGPPTGGPIVRVQHALRAAAIEEMAFDEFLERCQPYFAGTGCVIDQPFQHRLSEGMIRCYLVHEKVVGFGHQFVTALMPPPPGESSSPAPPPRLYYGPVKPEFQALKARLECEWVTQMQRLLDIDTESLPAIWDADFLYGPPGESGEDTYVLCEINVSSVFPFPEEALEPLAEAVLARVLDGRKARDLRPRQAG
ncbi:MAG: Cj0069 family protein [Chloroflexi bacterium]|nr:Cj0069 family protein [Chloroflexota bacterium]